MEVFNNEQFGSVRIIEGGDKYLFCGLDVAAALGYAKPRNAIAAHYRCALKRGVPHPQAQSNKQRSDILCKQIPKGGQT